MRLSEWRAVAPHKESMGPKVLAVIEPVATALGAEPDPSSWIIWGEDPASRYTVLTLSTAGLLLIAVRVNVPQEGPRASAKLIRWNRVQTGELAIEYVAGHRLLSFQVEGLILRGSDAEADAIAGFALELFAAMDGRPAPAPAPKRARAGGKSAAGGSTLRLPAPKGRTR
jgi:hypothetical protein